MKPNVVYFLVDNLGIFGRCIIEWLKHNKKGLPASTLRPDERFRALVGILSDPSIPVKYELSKHPAVPRHGAASSGPLWNGASYMTATTSFADGVLMQSSPGL